MNRIVPLSFLVFLNLFSVNLVFPFVDNASAENSMKYGVVDIQKVLSTSKDGKEANAKFNTEVKNLQKDIDEKKGQVEKQEQGYLKQKDSLSETAKADKEDKLITLKRDLQRTFQDSQEQLRKRYSQIVEELVKKIKKEVEEYSNEEGFTLVFEKNSPALVYASSPVDITDAILKKFDGA